ncbi:MAG: response regulator [Rickettsiales bacterium]|nr:response regulator [Rickettsiales bacterium]
MDNIRSKFYILFLDDEENSVKYFDKLFGQFFKVIATSDPSEILRIIDEKPEEIAVVVTDQKMPTASGVDLLALVKEKNRNIVRILTTAYASLENNIEAINKGNVFAYLTKPWDFENTKAILTKALEEFEIRQNYISLSGSIAHEMRNPLSNVRQSTKLVKERLSAAHQQERFCNGAAEKITPLTKQDFQDIISSLDLADRSATRGNAIIDIILNNISGKSAIVGNLHVVPATTIIKKVIDEYAFKDNEKAKITVNAEREHDFKIRCNENSLIYVFFNLLKNSLYYASSTPDLHIIIRIEDGKDQFNRIYFRDNGPGIPASKLDGIFGAFSTSGKKGGTGLGLTFCKRSMRSINGDILCNSEEGKFTEFVLEFPKVTNETYQNESENKILIVDDQETNLMVTKSFLEKSLYATRCDKATNCNEALDLIKNNRYNVILMDIEMPEIDGILTTKEIRKFNNGTPVLAYSSKNLDLVISDLKTSGFNGYVSKSSSPAILLKMVSKWGMVKLKDEVKEARNQEYLRKKRVLIADDEESNLIITAKYLSKYQVEIDKARDGSEAIGLIKKNNYDLILMDIEMPKMDGIEAVEEIRKFQKNNNSSRTPVIAITGDNHKLQIYKILSAGFDDYFIKGNDYDDLYRILEFWSSMASDRSNVFISLPGNLKEISSKSC